MFAFRRCHLVRIISKLRRSELSAYYGKLGVDGNANMTHHVARAFGILLELQLDSVFCVHKAPVTAVHCLICQGVLFFMSIVSLCNNIAAFKRPSLGVDY